MFNQEFNQNNSYSIDYIGNEPDIRVLIDNNWITANAYQVEGYIEYTKYSHRISYEYDKNNVKFLIIRNNHNDGLYIIYNNDVKIPIVDFNNVRVFLLDQPTLNRYHLWYPARQYQAWAYFDFLYSNDESRQYISNNLNNNINYNFTSSIIIPNIYCNESDIIFKISRNDNGSIYYERNNIERTRIRISDNSHVRDGYSGFYRRMTMDPGIIFNFTPPPTKIDLPSNVIIETTNNEFEQCVICFLNKQNITFLPCNHYQT